MAASCYMMELVRKKFNPKIDGLASHLLNKMGTMLDAVNDKLVHFKELKVERLGRYDTL